MQPDNLSLFYAVNDGRMALRFLRLGKLDMALGRLVMAWRALSFEAGLAVAHGDDARAARVVRIQKLVGRVTSLLTDEIQRQGWAVESLKRLVEDEGRLANRHRREGRA